jgi:hypothetical protein
MHVIASDSDTSRTIVSSPPTYSLTDKLLALFGGSSIDVASTTRVSKHYAGIDMTLYVVRGAIQHSTRMQLVQVNQIPVELEWLSAAVARDVVQATTPQVGPVK